MSYQVNKSLIEYGDLNSMHHSDVQTAMQAGERQHKIESQPAFLQTRLLIGGSYIIEWSKGEAEVPVECQGLWTGSSQANNAIKLCMKRLTEEFEASKINKKVLKSKVDKTATEKSA